MPPEVRERIFEPFFTTARGQGSTGLGLHIVFNLVTRTLGGSLVCESTPGQGTSFHVTMPV
jgi:signal transduction histidine kinase